MKTIVRRRRPIMAISVLVIAVLAVQLIFPGTLLATVQEVTRFLQTLVVGEHTTIEQFNPDYKPRVPPTIHKGMHKVKAGIGDFSILMPEKGISGVHHYVNIDLARAAMPSLDIEEPAYIPDGYKLSEVLVVGDTSYLFYQRSNQEIVISQSPVKTKKDSAGKNIKRVVEVVTHNSIEKVSIHGKDAVWLKSGIIWEANGLSYSVGGKDLDKDTAIRIAESIE